MSWWGGRGYTIASLVVLGIILALFLPQIVSFLSYGISSVINVTNMLADVFAEANNVSKPKTISIKAGNYTAVVPQVSADPVLSALENAIMPFLVAVVKVFTDPIILGMVLGVTLIILALSMRTQ